MSGAQHQSTFTVKAWLSRLNNAISIETGARCIVLCCAAGEAKPAKLSKKERAQQARARKRRDREAGSDDEDLGALSHFADIILGVPEMFL